MLLGWKFLTFMLRTINNPLSLPTTPMVFCAHHWLITHIFIFVESCCYRKGFWSQGWNRLFRLLEKTKCTSNISLLIQKSCPWLFKYFGKIKSKIFTEMGNQGKSFCLNQAHKGFSNDKGKWLLIYVWSLWAASWALSYDNAPHAGLNFLAHCRGTQPLVHDMNN